MSAIFTVWQRIGACVALLLLGACSALHVDVDVYKGPLANHEDTQLQQYAALAIAAKPIIVALRDEQILALKGKTGFENEYALDSQCLANNAKIYGQDGYLPCFFQLDVAYFLNEILALYEDKVIVDAWQNAAKTVPGSRPSGDGLVPRIGFSSKMPNSSDNTRQVTARDALGITKLTQQFLDAGYGANPQKNKADARTRLNESLIIFAESILFIVNNHDLAFGGGKRSEGAIPGFFRNASENLFGGEKRQSFAQKMAVLQSLGNTLIVHADDLRRRAEHDKHQGERANIEKFAVQAAIEIGAPQAFNNLLDGVNSRLQQATSKRLIAEKNLQSLEKAGDVQAKINSQEKQIAQLLQASGAALAVYRTIFEKFEFPSSEEDKKAQTDRETMLAIINKEGDQQNLRGLLKLLSAQIDALDSSNVIAVAPPADVVARRKAAKAYLNRAQVQSFSIADGTSKAVAAGLKNKLTEPLHDVGVRLSALKADLEENKKVLAVINKEDTSLQAAKAQEEKERLVLAALKGLRSSILSQAELINIKDMAGMRSLLLKELEAKSRLTPVPAGVSDAIVAMQQVTPPAKPINNSATTQRDAMDGVIAQLRHLQIQAAASGASPERQAELSRALAIAYEQRGGFAYLRPASTYLRNAYANTSVQGGTSYSSNLLRPKIGFDDTFDRAFRDTKLEIDKQYWQNINSIKVEGNGKTDYALVKDDVGNWYVKGFDADPEKLFKTAQSLALFNMGGKFNVNLLQQVEDRRRLSTETDPVERGKIRAELDKAKAGSAANIDGVNNVHVKFRAEYQGDTNKHLDGLKTDLEKLSAAIKKSWDGVPFGASKESSLAALNTILAGEAEAIAKAQKEIQDAKEGAAKKTDPNEASGLLADGVVNGLRQTRNLRTRLASNVLGSADVIAKAKKDSDDATAAAEAQQKKVKDAEKLRDDRIVEERQARDKVPTPPKEPEQGNYTKAQNRLTDAETDLAKEKTKLETARENEKTANAALAKAIENRKLAAKNLNGVINNILETTASKRLDTVRTYESAVTFIGETVGGK